MFDVLATPVTPTPLPHSTLGEAISDLFTLGANVLQAQRCSLYLRDSNEMQMHLHQEIGLGVREEVSHIAVEGTITEVVMHTRLPLLVQDPADYPTLPLHPDRYKSNSFISVPILVEDHIAGVFNATERHEGSVFSEGDLRNAEMVARSISALLHSESLAQRLQSSSEIDPVTGLYNVRHLAKRLSQEVERATRAQSPLTLLLINVAPYADLAARVGLQSAGLLMRSVGDMIAQTIRQSDILARWSDDELAILLPSTSLDKARRVARMISYEVVHSKLPAHLRYDLDDLRISIGFAGLSAAMDAETLIQQALVALAEARNSTEDFVMAAGDDAPMGPSRSHGRAVHQQTIAAALQLGIPYLADPAQAATTSALKLISPETARTYLCFPIAFESGTLTLAMADPTDSSAIQAISQQANMAIYPVVSPREKILAAIATRLDNRGRRDGDTVRIHLMPSTDPRELDEQMHRVIDAMLSLHHDPLTYEGIVIAHPHSRHECARLLAALIDKVDLKLRLDKSDAGLLHLEP